MKKNSIKEMAPVPLAPIRSSKDKGSPSKADLEEAEAQHHADHKDNLYKINFSNSVNKFKGKWRHYCTTIFYVLTSVITMLISIVAIIFTAFASVATKVYDSDQSSRLVAMIVLAVTSAITLCLLIYTVIGAVRKKTKPLDAAGLVLVILAIIQALIIGLAVKVSPHDEQHIRQSLTESFKLAKANNPRHVKLWDSTQHDFECCGVNGPDDYRDPVIPIYFAPNIAVSCCPTYDINKPSHDQERQRELCKVSKTFYHKGCKEFVVVVFKETATGVIGIVVVLIVLEIILALLGAYLAKKQKKIHKEAHEDHDMSHTHQVK